jgi:hypothetical protein
MGCSKAGFIMAGPGRQVCVSRHTPGRSEAHPGANDRLPLGFGTGGITVAGQLTNPAAAETELSSPFSQFSPVHVFPLFACAPHYALRGYRKMSSPKRAFFLIATEAEDGELLASLALGRVQKQLRCLGRHSNILKHI